MAGMFLGDERKRTTDEVSIAFTKCRQNQDPGRILG